ncbi:unknown [Firmicutes bacterium CAG:240]|nr:unknown [Firmicutes bacterium CAG:240]
MECVKLQRYHYSTLISGDVNSRAMRREPELAIADCTERYDELYKKLQNKLK